MIAARSHCCIGVLILALGAPPAMAQEPHSGVTIDIESIRELLLFGFEQNKLMDIEFARAIPDSALRWKPTPEVRDFAEQVRHIARDYTLFIAGPVFGIERPTFGDSGAYLNDKEVLAHWVTENYD